MDKINKMDADLKEYQKIVNQLALIRENNLNSPVKISCDDVEVEIRRREAISPIRNLIKDFEYTMAIIERNKKEVLQKGN